MWLIYSGMVLYRYFIKSTQYRIELKILVSPIANTRQSTSACVITNMLHFRHSNNLPKPDMLVVVIVGLPQ